MADTYLGVRIPAPATLEKYGLSMAAWKRMLKRQGGVCGVCGRVPESQRLVIDHDHVPRWKYMPPEKRVLYVRGTCCNTCNHYVLTRYADAKKHEQAALYLRRYGRRKK